MKIFARDYNIVPNREVAVELNDLLLKLQNIAGDKELILDSGIYYLDAKNCPVEHYHITNTVAEDYYRDGEDKWRTVIGLHLKNIHDLVLNGGNSTFIIDGYATNMAIVDCQNITIKDLTIKSKKPRIFRMRVKKRTLFTAELEFGNDTEFSIENGKRLYLGDKKDEFFMERGNTSGHVYLNTDDDRFPTHYTRAKSNPIKNARSFEKVGEKRVIAHGFFNPKLLNVHFNYYYFDDRRKQSGIFMSGSENLKFLNVAQRYSPGLAFVAQDCKDIYAEKLDFAPEKGSEIQMFSVADFMHICCCRGQITVKNSYFSSANDDVINVHGIHFSIDAINGNKIEVKFKHPEAYGFNIFHKGDELALIDPQTLLERGNNKVMSAELKDLYTLSLTLEKPLDEKYVGYAIENISACPNLLFEGNTSERVSTRTILVTTRGKVVIRNNNFIYSKMRILDISDDVSGWFESGMIKDVTFENNKINECDDIAILVLPLNKKHEGFVHNNLTIKNNIFNVKKHPCYKFKGVGNVSISGNKYICKSLLPTKKMICLEQVEIKQKDFNA